jgi:hypothetical protein
MQRKYTKEIMTILGVLEHARKNSLPLPVAVESYRKDLRRSMRVWSKRRQTYIKRGYGSHAIIDSCARAQKNLRLESARARRLQLRYASWNVGGICSRRWLAYD